MNLWPVETDVFHATQKGPRADVVEKPLKINTTCSNMTL